jgi:hypothetical protein
LANDYKMAELWQPEASKAGSRAAILAHKEGPQLDLWTPEASKAGNSAAGIAMSRKNTMGPKEDTTSSEERRKKALMAATGAFSGSRKRAGSTPTPMNPPSSPSPNIGRAALNAATVAHRPYSTMTETELSRPSAKAMEAARIQHSHAPRDMYTEAPPVSIEVEEKRHQDALRASAISMAKKMYEIQQHHIDEVTASVRGDGHTAATKVHQRAPSASSQDDIKQQAMQYISLQDAAQKLAAERLAKLKTDDGAAFRDYYGYPKTSPRSRLSIRGRRRASSEGALVDSDDEEQSKRIRSQMSLLHNQMAEVDAKKRQKDREALLAAAQKKVQAEMHDMDEKVFMETGKVPKSMMEEWEAKAQAKAMADSEARMANHGKVHVGGGKYLDQSEIDAVAAARIQPTLDEINEKTEAQRAKDEEMRLDREEKLRQSRTEKERENELKAEQKRAKGKFSIDPN